MKSKLGRGRNEDVLDVRYRKKWIGSIDHKSQ